jgi:hypothetical protein
LPGPGSSPVGSFIQTFTRIIHWIILCACPSGTFIMKKY